MTWRSLAKRFSVRPSKEWPLLWLEWVLRRLLFVFGLSLTQLLNPLCFEGAFNLLLSQYLSEDWSLVSRVWAQVSDYGIIQGYAAQSLCLRPELHRILGLQGHSVTQKGYDLRCTSCFSLILRHYNNTLSWASWGNKTCTVSSLWNRMV